MMKKAYVKPVFLAEEFEGTTAVAGCGKGSVNEEIELQIGGFLCYQDKDGTLSGDSGHIIGGKNDKTPVLEYWEDAGVKENDQTVGVYLFTDSNVVCDFLWSGQDSNVKGWSNNGEKSGLVWDVEERKKQESRNFYDFGEKLLKFFCGVGANNDQHNPGYNGYLFFS